MRFSFLLVGCLSILFVRCNDDECSRSVAQDLLDQVDQAQLVVDQQLISDYIASNKLGPTQEVNGITYILEQEGSGSTPCLDNDVTVSYEGRLMSDESVFDKNFNGATFPLNRLVLGWQLSFPSFSKGTKATIFIPSGYGYGPAGLSPRIPPNSNLIFEIELTNIR